MEIRDYLKLVWFYRWLILLCGILGIVIAVVIALRNPKTFEAVFSLAVGQTRAEQTEGYQYEGYYALQTADQIAISAMAWLPSPDVINKIKSKANLSEAELVIQPTLNVTKLGPRTLQVRWTGKSSDVLEKLAAATVAVAQEKIKTSGNIPSGALYGATIEKPVVSNMTLGKKIHAVIGFLGGLLAGILLAFVIQFFTPWVRFVFEIKRLVGKNPIFLIKSGNSQEENERRADLLRLVLERNENLNLLFLPISRSNYRLPLLVRDLANSFAHTGKSVALVDADLATASLSSFVGLGAAEGLGEFGAGETLSDLFKPVSEKIYCLPAGSRPADLGQTLSLLSWEKVVDVLRAYGVGMIAAPPADLSLELVRTAGNAKTIFVVELNKSKVKLLEQAAALWSAKGLDFEVIVLE